MSAAPRLSAFAAILLTASTVACHSWRVQSASPAAVLRDQRPARVQVHQVDGARFVLARPALVGDTITGLRAGAAAEIPLAAVDRLAVRRFSTGKTALLVLSIPAGLFGIILISCATSNCGY
jgi:hypothetical protein